MKIDHLVNDITQWMINYHHESKRESWIIGVSGGIDSAVATSLAVRTNIPTLGIVMPMSTSNHADVIFINRAFNLFNTIRQNYRITCQTIPIQPIIESYQKCGVGLSFIYNENNTFSSYRPIREGNLRSRIRANILYDIACEYCGLVVGTGNKDEDEIGYFTKGGDGLVDICPLSDLHKSTVYKLAEYLDVPQEIIQASPSAGLWDNQTDQQELGMSYDEIEWALDYDDTVTMQKYLGPYQQNVLLKVREMRRKNKHKLCYPPVFKLTREEKGGKNESAN